MSHHIFDTHLTVTVHAGWDRPCQGFFYSLVIGDRPSLVAPEYWPNLDEMLEELHNDYGIDLPMEMVEELEHNQSVNAGNIIKKFPRLYDPTETDEQMQARHDMENGK